jgi:hypothetical protein
VIYNFTSVIDAREGVIYNSRENYRWEVRWVIYNIYEYYRWEYVSIIDVRV